MTPQQEHIAKALRIFLTPGQVTELRALGVGGRRALHEFFDDPIAASAWALAMERDGARGVYFTPNPLRPDLMGTAASSRKADVLRRHWLLIDIDPVRPPDVSSTDEERAAGWRVLERVQGVMAAAGMRSPVVGDSGNGWHLSYPIDVANDDASQERIKVILQRLQAKCGDASAVVDTRTFDAPRIWKLYGTLARKGESTPERPHRYARLIEGTPWK